MIKTNLLSGALGAEITGIDLKDSTTENWNKINNLLLEHKALFFRDQDISSEEQISLAKHFGPLEKHIYVKGREEYPEILRIIKEPDEKHQWGETWHTDVSYNPKPTKVIILRSLKIPPVGGDTMFSNMYMAYDSLSKPMQNFLNGLRALHESEHFYRNRYEKQDELDPNKKYPSAIHPIVRTHPETKKKALYVNKFFTTRIEGLSNEET